MAPGQLPANQESPFYPSYAPKGSAGAENVEWSDLRLTGAEELAVSAGKKLRNDGLLITEYAPTVLRHELAPVPLWRGHHVNVKQLWDDFTRYLYLPRLRDAQVPVWAVGHGPGLLRWEHDAFGHAERFDEGGGKYIGLRAGTHCSALLDGHSVLVTFEAARRQLDTDQEIMEPRPEPDDREKPRPDGLGQIKGKGEPPPPLSPRVYRRFRGKVQLNPLRAARDVDTRSSRRSSSTWRPSRTPRWRWFSS